MKQHSGTLGMIIIFFGGCSILQAQEAASDTIKYGWTQEIVGNINLSQTSFDNWSQGGENTFAWQTSLNASFVNDQSRYNWSNSANFEYGRSKVGDAGARKSVDEIKLESVYSYKLGIELDPYISVTALTQITKGYEYTDGSRTAVADFLAPGYFTQGIGFGYSPLQSLKTRLGFALKETVAREFAAHYTDDPGTNKIEKVKTEPGLESSTSFNIKVSDNSLIKSKLDLFSNLKRFDEIDVRWDTIFTTKVSQYLNFNFSLNLYYDKDISKKRQIKQALTFGLTYTFL